MSKIALLFPGQGAQHLGMGQAAYEQLPAAKALFEQASQILGFDLAEVCFRGPEEKLHSTVVSQPAIFVTSLAALERVRTDTPAVIENAAATAGLSLGEYTSLVFAGAMSFEDGLRVVQKRGQAMQAAADASQSGMVSLLMLDLDKVKQIRDEAAQVGRIEIANYLCPGNVVLSGDKTACARAGELAEKAGGRPIALTVAGAFHTEIMRPADEQLARALAGVTIRPPRIPVISNVDAAPHSDPDEIRNILVRQVLNPVRWEDSMNLLLAEGYDEFYEIGPGRVLTGLMKRISRKTPCQVVNG